MATHVVIPDTQAKPGVPTKHLEWIGWYIQESFSDREEVTVVHLGDHWDMPSLSSYDKGRKAMEGRRYVADIDAGNKAFQLLDRAIGDGDFRKVFLLGNHEDRITRAAESDAQLEGILSLDQLNATELGWEVYPFLKPVFIDGVGYAHYWQNNMTGKPLGGMALTRLKTLGHSFTMGHQQTYDIAVRFVNGKKQRALIAGACYLHNEDYKGFQGNAHWRGIVVCNEVKDGAYDLMEVSLDYLCRRYEGKSLSAFKNRK